MEIRARRRRDRKERTFIIVRRTLTVPKAILAGSIPDTSFEKFKASMAKFKVERVVSCPFGR